MENSDDQVAVSHTNDDNNDQPGGFCSIKRSRHSLFLINLNSMIIQCWDITLQYKLKLKVYIILLTLIFNCTYLKNTFQRSQTQNCAQFDTFPVAAVLGA